MHESRGLGDVYKRQTLVPFLETSDELKTKPTQHSVATLRSTGIHPDVIVARSDREIDESVQRKISLFCDVDSDAVINAMNVDDIYAVVLNMYGGGLDRVVCRVLDIEAPGARLDDWKEMVHRLAHPTNEVTIGLVGKYVDLPDAYLSVVESLRHGGLANDTSVTIRWIPAEEVDGLLAESHLEGLDGIVVPGGFGIRGVEGKIRAIRYAREEGIPFLGLCLGLQCAVIEYARNVLGAADAHSTEFDPTTQTPVIDLMLDQHDVEDMGGTMRLGVYPARLEEGSLAYRLHGQPVVYERHRHRWEVNNRYRKALADAGLIASGVSPDERLVEIVEIPAHPYFIATQFHPEFTSRPDDPNPLFVGLVRAALARRAGLRRQENLSPAVQIDS